MEIKPENIKRVSAQEQYYEYHFECDPNYYQLQSAIKHKLAEAIGLEMLNKGLLNITETREAGGKTTIRADIEIITHNKDNQLLV